MIAWGQSECQILFNSTVVFAPVGAGEPAAGQNQKDRAGKVPQHHKFGVAENPFGDDATEDKKDEQKKV